MLDKLSITINEGETVAITGITVQAKPPSRVFSARWNSRNLAALPSTPFPSHANAPNGNMQSLKRADREKLRATIGYVMQHPERQLFRRNR